MKVAVLPNLDKKGSAVTVERIGVFFKEQGIEAYLPDNICCDKYEHLPEEELYKIADIIVTIGGDGTIIRYAKRAAVDNKPIVGINAGRMGYLANIEQNEYKLLSKLKTGEYDIEKRMMLNIKLYENGKEVGNFNALNDSFILSPFVLSAASSHLYPGQKEGKTTLYIFLFFQRSFKFTNTFSNIINFFFSI